MRVTLLVTVKDPANVCVPSTEVSQHHFDPAIDNITLWGGCLMKVTLLIAVKDPEKACVPSTTLIL